ncbi:MAG TPA: deoxyribonuclease IV [Candidatus Babeliales bacterium]|nr:deoxyribonuclease IV [Candidatus Babeliales bacterium]
MKDVGIHVRLNGSLLSALERIVIAGMPFFQCFLVSHKSNDMIHVTEQEKKDFLVMRRAWAGNIYLHASYWINLAGVQYTGHRALYRELRLARSLEFTHIVAHSGSAKGAAHKSDGIDALARAVNEFLTYESSLSLVLENTAHGGMAVGGDFNDFKAMLELVDKPERVSFCVDTAHAHSYGYNLIGQENRQQFIDVLEKTIGIDAIGLIHLNDTAEKLGSKIDRHEVLGEGVLGMQALKEFVLDERLAQIPILLELPVVSSEQELATVEIVRSW